MVRMNKALRVFQTFLDDNNLEAEVFTAPINDLPTNFKPSSVVSVKDDLKVLFVFACSREKFWIDVVDESAETQYLVSQLRKRLRNIGLREVR